MKRSSLHYKAIEFWGVHPSRSLCLYFWQAVSAFTFIPIAALVVLCIALAAAITLIAGVAMLPMVLLGYLTYIEDSWQTLPLAAGFAAWVVGIVYISQYTYKSTKGQPQVNKFLENNLVIEYYKAKKAKICPIIEFED